MGFSQTEALAEGFDYKSLAKHLLGSEIPDPQAVCDDFFQQYITQSGVYQSATISMVDCTKMSSLAQTCSKLFAEYRETLSQLKESQVQRYYRGDYHWFFDLYDIIAKAGATEEELSELIRKQDSDLTEGDLMCIFQGALPAGYYQEVMYFLPTALKHIAENKEISEELKYLKVLKENNGEAEEDDEEAQKRH